VRDRWESEPGVFVHAERGVFKTQKKKVVGVRSYNQVEKKKKNWKEKGEGNALSLVQKKVGNKVLLLVKSKNLKKKPKISKTQRGKEKRKVENQWDSDQIVSYSEKDPPHSKNRRLVFEDGCSCKTGIKREEFKRKKTAAKK